MLHDRVEGALVERDTDYRLPIGLGVLVVILFGGVTQAWGWLRNTRVLTRIRVDGWARRHGW